MDLWVYGKVNAETFSAARLCFSHIYSVISSNNLIHSAVVVRLVNLKAKPLGNQASGSCGVIHCAQRQELDIFHCMHTQSLTHSSHL